MEYKAETKTDPLDCTAVEEPKKICVVCGDKALGYNFNAITCESCKAFFRRNALKKKAYKCRFTGDCGITIASRRYCQKCRLRKCFQMGMLSELITVRPDEEGEPQEARWPEPVAMPTPGLISTSAPVIKKRQSQEPISFAPPPKLYPTDAGRMTPAFFSPLPVSVTPLAYQSATPLPYQSVCTHQIESQHYVDSTQKISNDQTDYNLPSICSHQTDVGNAESPSITEIGEPSTSAGSTADPLIPLPKSILLHLIDLRHHGAQDQSHKRQKQDVEGNQRLPIPCICRCTCGAESPRMCSANEVTDVVVCTEAAPDRASKKNATGDDNQRKRPSIVWTDQALQHVDHVISTCDKHTSTALDLIHNGPVIEFPPDIDVWKLFRLEELLSANEILAPPRNNSGPLVSFADTALAADMMDLAIRRMLEMVKCVSAFGILSAPDQIALFKGSVRELVCLRGAMVYEASVKSFRPVGYPHRYLRLDAMRRAQDGHVELVSYFESFRQQWRKCDPIMLCLTSIVVFEPTRPNLTDVAAVRSHQQFYLDLLKCYLRTMYSPLEAEQVFEKLLNRLRVLKENLEHLVPTIHIEMSSGDLEPLLVDIIPSQ